MQAPEISPLSQQEVARRFEEITVELTAAEPFGVDILGDPTSENMAQVFRLGDEACSRIVGSQREEELDDPDLLRSPPPPPPPQ